MCGAFRDVAIVGLVTAPVQEHRHHTQKSCRQMSRVFGTQQHRKQKEICLELAKNVSNSLDRYCCANNRTEEFPSVVRA